VTVRVTDSADPSCSDFETITVTVNDVGGGNTCPELAAIGNRTVDELTLLTFTATATDPDAGQTLTFSLDAGFPTGASIDPSTGVFTFTPTEEQGPGSYTVTVRVTDSADPTCSDFETITITVNEVGGGGNQCPVITPIDNRTITEGETVTFTVMATDPENTALVYSLIGGPPGAQIHPLTGLFTWTPTDAQAGTYTITVQVRDTCEEPCTVTATVTIVVNDSQPPNECPVLSSIGNRTVEEEDLLTFTATATDPDAGQTLTFSLDPGFPTGASIDPSTGVFTFTPTHEQIGTHSITVRVTDNADPACSDFEDDPGHGRGGRQRVPGPRTDRQQDGDGRGDSDVHGHRDRRGERRDHLLARRGRSGRIRDPRQLRRVHVDADLGAGTRNVQHHDPGDRPLRFAVQRHRDDRGHGARPSAARTSARSSPRSETAR
jgi:hypothetical protein